MRRFFWFLVGAFVAVAIAVYLSQDILKLYFEQSAERTLSTKRLKVAEEKRGKLLEKKAQLESPSGREKLARTHGYQKENETPLQTGN
jgi:hypothetical protein